MGALLAGAAERQHHVVVPLGQLDLVQDGGAIQVGDPPRQHVGDGTAAAWRSPSSTSLTIDTGVAIDLVNLYYLGEKC